MESFDYGELAARVKFPGDDNSRIGLILQSRVGAYFVIMGRAPSREWGRGSYHLYITSSINEAEELIHSLVPGSILEWS